MQNLFLYNAENGTFLLQSSTDSFTTLLVYGLLQ